MTSKVIEVENTTEKKSFPCLMKWENDDKSFSFIVLFETERRGVIVNISNKDPDYVLVRHLGESSNNFIIEEFEALPPGTKIELIA